MKIIRKVVNNNMSQPASYQNSCEDKEQEIVHFLRKYFLDSRKMTSKYFFASQSYTSEISYDKCEKIEYPVSIDLNSSERERYHSTETEIKRFFYMHHQDKSNSIIQKREPIMLGSLFFPISQMGRDSFLRILLEELSSPGGSNKHQPCCHRKRKGLPFQISVLQEDDDRQ